MKIICSTLHKTCPSKSLLLPGFTVNKRITQGPSSATVSSCLSMSWPVLWSNEVAFALREIIDMCDTSINKSAPRESCQQPSQCNVSQWHNQFLIWLVYHLLLLWVPTNKCLIRTVKYLVFKFWQLDCPQFIEMLPSARERR